MPEELKTPDKSLKEIERDNFKIRLNNYIYHFAKIWTWLVNKMSIICKLTDEIANVII